MKYPKEKIDYDRFVMRNTAFRGDMNVTFTTSRRRSSDAVARSKSERDRRGLFAAHHVRRDAAGRIAR